MTDNLNALFNNLFPSGHAIVRDGDIFVGRGKTEQGGIAVIGTPENTAIGVELALRLAEAFLAVIRDHPGRPILMLVDTTGQRLSRRDEMLGINGYLAYLAKCVDLARQRGHHIIGLVYRQAVSGGFLATSLLADECYALPGAEIRVMSLPAMSRVTKIPLERLIKLSQESPVFAPGIENFLRMGAISGIWNGPLDKDLTAALKISPGRDRRRQLGETRAGRLLARRVSDRVCHEN